MSYLEEHLCTFATKALQEKLVSELSSVGMVADSFKQGWHPLSRWTCRRQCKLHPAGLGRPEVMGLSDYFKGILKE